MFYDELLKRTDPKYVVFEMDCGWVVVGGHNPVEYLSRSPERFPLLHIKDEVKGETPCGFLVLKAGVDRPPHEIEKEVVQLVRDKIGPVAAFRAALVVPRLPKTRSGKILRGTMKKIADHDQWVAPATIEDPKALEEIAAALDARAR